MNAVVQFVVTNYPTQVARVVLGGLDPFFGANNINPAAFSSSIGKIGDKLLGLPVTYATGSLSGSVAPAGEQDVVEGAYSITLGLINYWKMSTMTPQIANIMKSAASLSSLRYPKLP